MSQKVMKNSLRRPSDPGVHWTLSLTQQNTHFQKVDVHTNHVEVVYKGGFWRILKIPYASTPQSRTSP